MTKLRNNITRIKVWKGLMLKETIRTVKEFVDYMEFKGIKVDRASIYQALKGKRHTAYGHRFELDDTDTVTLKRKEQRDAWLDDDPNDEPYSGDEFKVEDRPTAKTSKVDTEDW